MENSEKEDEAYPTPPPYFEPALEALSSSPRPTYVSYETELFCYPALTTCPFCKTQVTTHVTYRVGGLVWLMCFLMVFCG
ncbi:hypothetical protein EYF80_042932 [Liparis tanakae]|uniref:LITAF domain-containing protein n=1 Tax=Liparis tanakae TaxID=230148 RepID=A0A4Z2FZX4_9TELE|nr:hypothetical protein EYF80_042932 [Liparis tanakae]